MRFSYSRTAIIALFIFLAAFTVHASDTADTAIRKVMTAQCDAWNRGDIDTFATYYKNSPETLFIGKSVRRGYDQMLASYKKGYPTREAMGVLTFTDLEVHPLDQNFAAVIGKFHLERTQAGGGNADGIFSLIFEKTPDGWKIVLDHTS